jgi:cytoskeletal protein CcmA (bactofilin family)
MGGRDGRRSPAPPLTKIAPGTSVRGDVTFAGLLQVDGRIVGDVTAEPVADSEVHVGTGGCIEGAVTAGRLIVEGTVIGPVTARERLVLRSGGRLAGQIAYRDLQIEHGASIEGSLAALDAEGARVDAPFRLSAQRRDE